MKKLLGFFCIGIGVGIIIRNYVDYYWQTLILGFILGLLVSLTVYIVSNYANIAKQGKEIK